MGRGRADSGGGPRGAGQRSGTNGGRGRGECGGGGRARNLHWGDQGPLPSNVLKNAWILNPDWVLHLAPLDQGQAGRSVQNNEHIFLVRRWTGVFPTGPDNVETSGAMS